MKTCFMLASFIVYFLLLAITLFYSPLYLKLIYYSIGGNGDLLFQMRQEVHYQCLVFKIQIMLFGLLSNTI